MKFSPHLKITAITIAASLMMTSCTRNIASNNYSADSVGEAMLSYQGTIVSMRNVNIQEGDKLTDNMVGMGVGGLAGGVAGNMIGGGRGNTAATVGGALLGATAGAFAQRALSEQQGIEYSVKLTNGQMMTVVQGNDVVLQIGQRVIVQVSQKGGRSRVVPDSSPSQGVQPIPSSPQVVVNNRVA